MSGLLTRPPVADPAVVKLYNELRSDYLRREVQYLGSRWHGGTLTLRFKVPPSIHWARFHVQGVGSGQGGSTYDPDNFISSTEIDCRALNDRIQTIEVEHTPASPLYVWVIPVEKDDIGTVLTFDGEDGVPDHASFFKIPTRQVEDPYDHGAAGDGVANDHAALAAADAAAVAAGSYLNLPPGSTFKLGANLTLAAPLGPHGGIIDLNGFDLTLTSAPQTSRVRWIDDSGGGEVIFSTAQPVATMPEWWGAVPDGSTDCTAALQAAIDAAAAQGVEITSMMAALPTVSLGPGTYLTTGLTITKPVVLTGAGRIATIITSTTNDDIITLNVDDIVATYSPNMSPGLEDLTIVGGGNSAQTAQHGVRVIKNGSIRAWVHLDNVGIVMCGGGGLLSDTAVSNRIHRSFLINNYGPGAEFQGDHNTDIRITESVIRLNRIGVEFSGGHLYSIWIKGCLIENNAEGTGAAGSSTRPASGIVFSGSSFREGWIEGCYFEGHLNDIYGSTMVRNLHVENCYHAGRAVAASLLANGTPERQFGAAYFTSASCDSIRFSHCFMSQPIKPESVDDATWGTYNVRRTTTGDITSGSNVLTLTGGSSSVTGLRPGSLLSIDGVTGYFTVVSLEDYFQVDGNYEVTLDGNADATVSGATVSVHWGQSYAHLPSLPGRSHVIRDCLDIDLTNSRYYPVLVDAAAQFCTIESGAGTGATSTYTLSGPSEMRFQAWNAMRFRANSFLVDSLRSYIASTGCNVGASGEHRFIAASLDSTASGTQAMIAASRDSTVSGTRAAVVASNATVVSGINAAAIGSQNSEADQTRSVVLASLRTKPGGLSRITGGWADSGDPLTANRTFEVTTSTGNLQVAGTVSGSATFTDGAEVFENLHHGVIPLGTIVAREGRKVRPAAPGERIVGVVSGTAGIILGDTPFSWAGRYLTGEFGEPLYDEVEVDGESVRVYRENPEWDPSLPQVPRSERPEEYSVVALWGQVYVRIGEGVQVDDVLDPDGKLVVMEIKQPFDAEKGYGVAFCLLR